MVAIIQRPSISEDLFSQKRPRSDSPDDHDPLNGPSSSIQRVDSNLFSESRYIGRLSSDNLPIISQPDKLKPSLSIQTSASRGRSPGISSEESSASTTSKLSPWSPSKKPLKSNLVKTPLSSRSPSYERPRDPSVPKRAPIVVPDPALDTGEKGVRFARCTNASVFPALSQKEYDRSPIIVSCDSEALEISRNDDDNDGGWIKCFERVKKCRSPSSLKRDKDDARSSLGVESRSSSSSIIVAMASFTTKSMSLSTSMDYSTSLSSQGKYTQNNDHTGSLHDTSDDQDEDDGSKVLSLKFALEENLEVQSDSDNASLDGDDDILNPAGVQDDIEETPDDDDGDDLDCKPLSSRERFGMCGLGKYSRSDVFLSFDSLGGF